MLLYGYFAIGLLVGFLAYLLYGNENGLSLFPNLLLGLFGAYSTGILVELFNIGAEPLFAVIGSVCFTFIGNVFRPEQDHILH